MDKPISILMATNEFPYIQFSQFQITFKNNTEQRNQIFDLKPFTHIQNKIKIIEKVRKRQFFQYSDLD